MTLKELRELLRAAYTRMAAASQALDAAIDDDNVSDEQHTELRAAFDTASSEHESAKERLERAEAIEAAKRALPVEPVEGDDEPDEGRSPEVRVGKEPLTYEKRDGSTSYFLDHVRLDVNGDPAARERLQRHAKEMEVEKRTNPNSTDGQGGEFVPPLWMQDEWLALSKAGRAFADACRSMPLPPGIDSINLPKVLTGATTGTQTDAGAVSSTDITTGSYTVGVKTVAGQQDVSMQLLDRSRPGFDLVTYEELQGRYAINIDTQCLAGSGSGSNAQGIQTLSGTNAVTYTATTPTVQGLYSKIADGIQQVHTGRLLPPEAIVMHPRRWGWALAQSDSNGRPLVTPYAGQNLPAVLAKVAPESFVGTMQGLPVLLDPNITITNGAGTNEDIIYVVRLQDLWLMEDAPVKTRVLKEVLSGTLQVRIQLYNYFAFAAGRYPVSISKITGTGLATPSF